MSDHGSETGRNRLRINMSEERRVAYWSRKWGVTREQLAEAIREVGPMSSAVARRLGKEK